MLKFLSELRLAKNARKSDDMGILMRRGRMWGRVCGTERLQGSGSDEPLVLNFVCIVKLFTASYE